MVLLALAGQGCLFFLQGALVAAAAGERDATPSPTVTFENRLKEPVCAINLWRPSQPPAEAEANWLELTELFQLAPGQQVSVGILPREGAYRLRAIGCEARAFVLYDVSLPQVVPGSTFALGGSTTSSGSAPLPPTLGL
jgi:hypothetical protein